MSSDAASHLSASSPADSVPEKLSVPAAPVAEADAAVLVARKGGKKAKKAAPAAATQAVVPAKAPKTPLSRGIAFAVQIASLESVFVMMQFLFSTVIVRSFVLFIMSPLFSFLFPAPPVSAAVAEAEAAAAAAAAAAGTANPVPAPTNVHPIAHALAQLSGSFLSVLIVLIIMVRIRPVARIPRAVDAAATSVWAYERSIVAPPSQPSATGSPVARPSFLAKLAAAGHPHSPTEPLSRAAPPTFAELRAKTATETVEKGGGSWEWRVFVFLHKLGVLPLPEPAAGRAGGQGKGAVVAKSSGGVCSSYVVTVALLHTASTLVMLWLQRQSGVWLYSMENIYRPDSAVADDKAAVAGAFGLDWARVDWGRICDLWIVAPLCEELVFRGVVMSHFFFKLHEAYEKDAAADEEDNENDEEAKNVSVIVGSEDADEDDEGKDSAATTVTVAKSSTASPARAQAQASARARARALRRSGRLRVIASVSASAFFAALHLVNLFSARYSKPYVLLQVLMGGLVGLGYSLRLFAGSARIWECVALHVINNVFSTPVDPKMGTTEDAAAVAGGADEEGGPWAWARARVFGVPLLVWAAVIESVIVYAILAVKGVKDELKRADDEAAAVEAQVLAETGASAPVDYDEEEAEGVFGGWLAVTRLTSGDAATKKAAGGSKKGKKGALATKKD